VVRASFLHGPAPLWVTVAASPGDLDAALHGYRPWNLAVSQHFELVKNVGKKGEIGCPSVYHAFNTVSETFCMRKGQVVIAWHMEKLQESHVVREQRLKK
jgi:hypothetical protein